MIGYKIAFDNNKNRILVTLEILSDSKTNMNRDNIICKDKARYKTNKCKVLSLSSLDEVDKIKEVIVAYSSYDPTFKYEINKEIIVNDYKDIDDPFSNGIHFFLNKEMAINYQLCGSIVVYFENNVSKIKCEKPLEEGEYIVYYENGAVEQIYNFKNFKINGEIKHFRKNGELTHICYYEDNIYKNTQKLRGPPYI